MPQMTSFILLSDVTDLDGPTKVVPLEKTRDVPMGNRTNWASSSTTRSRSPGRPEA